MNTLRKRPLASMIIAIMALVMATGGTAVAAKLINGSSIKKKSIPGNRVKSNALTGTQINESKLARVPSAVQADRAKTATSATTAGTANSANTANTANRATTADSATTAQTSTVATQAKSLEGEVPFGLKRSTMSVAPDLATARANAAKVTVATIGQFTLYGKCFRETATPQSYAELFVETTINEAIFDGDEGEQAGGPATDYLNTDTTELDRRILSEDTADNAANIQGEGDSEFTLIAKSGLTVVGDVAVAVKHGALTGGDGPYGAGNQCLFTGQARVVAPAAG